MPNLEIAKFEGTRLKIPERIYTNNMVLQVPLRKHSLVRRAPDPQFSDKQDVHLKYCAYFNWLHSISSLNCQTRTLGVRHAISVAACPFIAKHTTWRCIG